MQYGGHTPLAESNQRNDGTIEKNTHRTLYVSGHHQWLIPPCADASAMAHGVVVRQQLLLQEVQQQWALRGSATQAAQPNATREQAPASQDRLSSIAGAEESQPQEDR